MSALLNFFPFALEGQWRGAAAIALVAVGILIFIGSVYVLLVTVYGWLQGYLVTMVALMAFSIILSAVWLVGIPGTIPGTGPRGTEPSWVAFIADSEQGAEFAGDIKGFPKGANPADGWRIPDASERYPGNLNSSGELDTVKATVAKALAGYFQRQKTGSAKPADYNFFPSHLEPKTEEDRSLIRALGKARVFFKPAGNVDKIDPATQLVTQTITTANPSTRLLVGIDYPAVKGKHPAIRVFAYRNKGQIFMASLQWMLASIVLFALHLWWLAGFEKKQKAREKQLAAGGLREPALA